MRTRVYASSGLAVVAVVVLVLALGVDRSSGQGTRAARTADGKPNLSGIWQVMNTANWDLLAHGVRPAVAQRGVYADHPVLAAPVVALGSLGGVPAGPSVVEGNEIPYTPEAAARKKENAEHWLDRDPEVRCYMPGIPRAMYLPYPFQITHGTNRIQMVFAYANASRTIHLDTAPPPPADKWMGHSIGRWEGDTLVVDVTNFNDRTWFSRSGDFHSDALHVVERFTPMTPDALRYEVTIEDPNVFTRPWKMNMVLYRQLEENATLIDYRCLELVEETFLGHVRKNQLVKRWEGETLILDVTRRIPPDDRRYER
jgi:hypothetical protein